MEAAAVGDRVLSRLREVSGTRLERVVAYGSSVTGDVLAGYSDLDLLIGLTAPLSLREMFTLQRSIDDLELAPFGYLQPTFALGRPVVPSLVPEAFEVLYGPEPPGEWICDADHLRRTGTAWLAQLPILTAGDAGDWAMTIRAHVPRHARLLMTRVKPSLRALLVRFGAGPVAAWTSSWSEITQDLDMLDAELSAGVRDLLGAAGRRRDRLVAQSALGVLTRVCSEHLCDP